MGFRTIEEAEKYEEEKEKYFTGIKQSSDKKRKTKSVSEFEEWEGKTGQEQRKRRWLEKEGKNSGPPPVLPLPWSRKEGITGPEIQI